MTDFLLFNRIDARRNELKARREKAKQKCAEREKQLQDAQALQEFKRDADEVVKHNSSNKSFNSCSFI
jgi:hypothetical protein